jgi:hypothetical protein
VVTSVTDRSCTEVKVVFKSPDRITESGIVVDGQEEDFDAIVCATGFECQYRPFLYAYSHDVSALLHGTNSTSELVGRNGTAIAQDWEPVSTVTRIVDSRKSLKDTIVATSLPRHTRPEFPELFHYRWPEKYLGSWIGNANGDS